MTDPASEAGMSLNTAVEAEEELRRQVLSPEIIGMPAFDRINELWP